MLQRESRNLEQDALAAQVTLRTLQAEIRRDVGCISISGRDVLRKARRLTTLAAGIALLGVLISRHRRPAALGGIPRQAVWLPHWLTAVNYVRAAVALTSTFQGQIRSRITRKPRPMSTTT